MLNHSRYVNKMVPSMAAVLRAQRKLCSFLYVLFVFLLFYVLDVVSITVYDRHTLLNIGSSVAQRKPDFEFLNAGALFTDTASQPFVWAARPKKRRRKRGKRAEVRPSDLLSQPFCWLTFSHWTTNSVNCGRTSHTNEKQGTAALLASQKPGCLQWFQTQPSSSRGSPCRGGGVCFYIKNLWCDERNLHSIKSFCSPDLEFHMLLCRPF